MIVFFLHQRGTEGRMPPSTFTNFVYSLIGKNHTGEIRLFVGQDTSARRYSRGSGCAHVRDARPHFFG